MKYLLIDRDKSRQGCKTFFNKSFQKFKIKIFSDGLVSQFSNFRKVCSFVDDRTFFTLNQSSFKNHYQTTHLSLPLAILSKIEASYVFNRFACDQS